MLQNILVLFKQIFVFLVTLASGGNYSGFPTEVLSTFRRNYSGSRRSDWNPSGGLNTSVGKHEVKVWKPALET